MISKELVHYIYGIRNMTLFLVLAADITCVPRVQFDGAPLLGHINQRRE